MRNNIAPSQPRLSVVINEPTKNDFFRRFFHASGALPEHFKFVAAIAGIHDMGMAINEGWGEPFTL